MDERIDIEVIDKVAKTIKPELLGISQAARNAHMQIAKLKRELGVTSTSGIGRATREVAAAERDASRAGAERARQATATARALDKEAASAARLTAKYEQQARAAKSQQAIGSLHGIGRSPKSAKDSYDVFNQSGKIDETTKKLDSMGKSAELGRHHLLNLGFQLQDIFVSLASGQKPLTVFIQQGGQIGQIAAQSGLGFGAMARAIGGVVGKFGPLILAAGGVSATLGLINREANKDDPIKKYAQSLGLTAKEMKKLEDVSVTTMDTLKAVFQVGMRNIAARLGIDTSAISRGWNSFLDAFLDSVKNTAANVYAAFAGMAYGVKNIIDNLNNGKEDDNPIANLARGFKEARQDAKDFFKDVGSQAEKNAQARVKEQADALKADRSGGGGSKGSKGVDRAAELAKINRELDQEFRLLQMIGKERDNETRWLDISNGLIDKKIKLTELETKAIQDKIKANRNEQDIQSAMQSFYDEIHGPQEQFKTGEEALNRLLAQGKIELMQYNRQMAILYRNYADSADYLAPMTRELEKQDRLVGSFGKNRAYKEFLEQMEDSAKAVGASIYKEPAANDNGDIVVPGARELTSQAALLAQTFVDQLKQQDFTSLAEDIFNGGQANNGNSYLIENYDALKDYYSEVATLRRGDFYDAEQSQRALAELDNRYTEARLSGVRQMFDNLTSLQGSKIKEIAAIGKAAAIAEATINGFLTVSQTMADRTLPTIIKIPLAISQGIFAAAQVAKIAGVGFQKGGYTGNMPAHAVAGQVHGQEFVMDAKATSRIGVANLEAMRNGRLNPGPAANSNGAKVTVINNAGAAVQVRERSDGELEIMIESAMQRKMGPMFERKLSNPNSRESRSIGNNYKVARNRQ